ncbi:MAG TPA: hypothetical protein VGG33_26105, partial [Polyangia bacterium]
SCMDKDRERRPTFEELAPALLKVHRRVGGALPRLTRPIFTLPVGVDPRAGGRAGTEEIDVPSSAELSEAGISDELPRRRGALVAATLTAAAAIAALTWWFTQH